MNYLPHLLSVLSLLFAMWSAFRRESREDREKKAQAAGLRDERLKTAEANYANMELRLTGFEQMIERVADTLGSRCAHLEQQFTVVPKIQQDMSAMQTEMKHVVDGLGKLERKLEKFGDKMDKVYELLTRAH